MRIFLLLLLLTIVAFGDSLSVIALANKDENKRFTTGFFDSILYTYRIILGDFSLEDFQNTETASIVAIWLFILCTVFNMIIMLNLLIAIISETFAKVNGSVRQAVFQEKASMIAEVAYLIPDYQKRTYAKKDLLILVIVDLEKVEDIFEDPVMQEITNLTGQVTSYFEMVISN